MKIAITGRVYRSSKFNVHGGECFLIGRGSVVAFLRRCSSELLPHAHRFTLSTAAAALEWPTAGEWPQLLPFSRRRVMARAAEGQPAQTSHRHPAFRPCTTPLRVTRSCYATINK